MTSANLYNLYNNSVGSNPPSMTSATIRGKKLADRIIKSMALPDNEARTNQNQGSDKVNIKSSDSYGSELISQMKQGKRVFDPDGNHEKGSQLQHSTYKLLGSAQSRILESLSNNTFEDDFTKLYFQTNGSSKNAYAEVLFRSLENFEYQTKDENGKIVKTTLGAAGKEEFMSKLQSLMKNPRTKARLKKNLSKQVNENKIIESDLKVEKHNKYGQGAAILGTSAAAIKVGAIPLAIKGGAAAIGLAKAGAIAAAGVAAGASLPALLVGGAAVLGTAYVADKLGAGDSIKNAINSTGADQIWDGTVGNLARGASHQLSKWGV
jgi:hypothetical protein